MTNHIALKAHDSLSRLEQAVKKTHDPALKIRIKAVILRKQGKTPQEIGALLVVTARSVNGWLCKYNEAGI